MSDKKPTVKLWSVAQGKLVNFIVSIENSEIVCQNGDEFIKFPGGITKDELLELVAAHNEANDGVKAISKEQIQAQEELDAANHALLESLQ